MKSLFAAILFTVSIPLTLLASRYSDTIIHTVNIQFGYDQSIFPSTWLTKEINATGQPILPGEINRTKLIIKAALSKYPDSLLSKELRVVYILRSMSMYNVKFGGTNSNDAVYLTNEGKEQGDSDWYIEQTFHHEFSSILYRNYPFLLDTVAWKAANISGFDYNDPEEGVGAIRKNSSSQDLDTTLCRVGFLTQYAYSGIENDINSIAENLFKPADGFWDVVDHFPRIKEKVQLLIKFYHNINPVFTEEYFKKLN